MFSTSMSVIGFFSNGKRLARNTNAEVKDASQNLECIVESVASIAATVSDTMDKMGQIYHQNYSDKELIKHLEKNKNSIYNKTREISLDQINQIWSIYEQEKKEDKKKITQKTELLFQEIKDCMPPSNRGQKIYDLIYDKKHEGCTHWRSIVKYVNNLPAPAAQEEKKPANYPSIVR